MHCFPGLLREGCGSVGVFRYFEGSHLKDFYAVAPEEREGLSLMYSLYAQALPQPPSPPL